MIFSSNIFSQDVVGVFTGDFQQVLCMARPIRASVKPTSRLMKHPKESGAETADHRVKDPIEIDLIVLLDPFDFSNVYQQIQTLYDSAESLIVQTKTGAYPDMVITAIPHDELPQLGNTASLTIKLQEIKIVTAQFEALPPRQVANSQDSSTRNRGEQPTTETSTERRESTLSKIFS